MPTNKLGLPTVTENMTHDVPRDLNALANAIDDKAGAPGGHATLGTDGMIPSEQMRPIPGLSTHMNDSIKHESYAVTAGTANSYTVTVSPTPSLTDGLAVAVKIHADSTGPATLNVNGLGAKPLKKANGNDVVGLKAQGIYSFRYNATTAAFILQGEGGNGNAQPGDVRKGKTFSNDYGDQTGTLDLSELTSENIRWGVTIDGVSGTIHEDPVERLVPGSTTIERNTNQTSTGVGTPTIGSSMKIREMIMNRPGDIRVSYYAAVGDRYTTFDAQFYINGTPYGTPRRDLSNTVFTAFTDDIRNLEAGDIVSLYVTRTSGSGAFLVNSFEASIGNRLPYATITM